MKTKISILVFGGLALWCGTPSLKAGIPEPGYLLYGNVSNIVDHTRVVSGTLHWTLRGEGGQVLTLETQLTNINDNTSYAIEIPMESILDGLQASSSNALQLTLDTLDIERSDVQQDGTHAWIVPPAKPTLSLSQEDRGLPERVDLGVILFSNEVTLTQIELIGPQSISASTVATYTNWVTFSNGETLDVTPMTQWSIAESLPEGSVLNQNVLHVGMLSSNVPLTLQAAYTYRDAAHADLLDIWLLALEILVDILQDDQIVLYEPGSFTLQGTSHSNVIGHLSWINEDMQVVGQLPAGSPWSLPVDLAVGPNRISVTGTNVLGHTAIDRIVLTRSTRFPNEPLWWYRRGVLNPDNEQGSEDFKWANQGQLKWLATQAYQEFEAILPGGAGSSVSNLVEQFAEADDYMGLNQGQTKRVAKPFYDRLWELDRTDAYPVGVSTKYPWDTSTYASDDFGPINIGQLKYLFSFEVE